MISNLINRKIFTLLKVQYSNMLEYRVEIALWAISGIIPFFMLNIWTNNNLNESINISDALLSRYFFSTLENDSDAWIAHQRASSKRVQSIGFNPEGSLWMLSRGAEIRFNEDTNDLENWSKPIIPILNGYNYLDMGWDPNGDIWAGGGNGTLIVSKDQGKTWNKDPIASELPTNYIKIVFLDKEALDNQKGFVLGERGYILKWNS